MKFSQFFKELSTKTYDPLNHRNDEFDKDYTIFKQKIVDAEWELEEFVERSLQNLHTVDDVLRLLKRYKLYIIIQYSLLYNLIISMSL